MSLTPDLIEVPPLADTLTTLRQTHERLSAAVRPLTPEQLAGPAYPSEWSIAQTLSHLGSGAEIFRRLMESTVTGGDPPDFPTIWDSWNAKSPEDQAADALTSNAAFLDAAAGLDPAAADAFSISLFGGDKDFEGFLRMRLSEAVLHTWDVVVALDPSATLAPEAAGIILDGLPPLVEMAGKPSADPVHAVIRTHDPNRLLALDFDDQGARLSSLDPGTPLDEGTARMPAEAVVRLVYGRLDPDHTPPLQPGNVDLDALRKAFPGF